MKEALRSLLHRPGLRSDQGMSTENGGKKWYLARNVVGLNYQR